MTNETDLAAEVALLKKKVEELEDIQKVRDVIYRYCLNFDFGRPASVLKLFTDDCSFVSDMFGEVRTRRGKTVLGESWLNRPRLKNREQHLQLNLVIHINGDTAHAYNYQIMRADREGEIDIGRCAFRSITLRRVNGEWLIHELYSLGVTNDEEVKKTLPETF